MNEALSGKTQTSAVYSDTRSLHSLGKGRWVVVAGGALACMVVFGLIGLSPQVHVRSSAASLVVAIRPSSPARNTLNQLERQVNSSVTRPAIPAKKHLTETGVKTLVRALGYPVPNNSDLMAIITRWQARYPGMTAGVSLQEIGGAGRSASVGGDDEMFAASIYKLYLEQYVYKQMDEGNIDGNTVLSNGRRVTDCLKAMIVVSDNPCGSAMGDTYGWTTLDTFMHEQGYSNTSFKTGYPSSTANDTAKLLVALQSGKLISASDRTDMLAAMQAQIYRSGIPAGVHTGSVADKVGFFGNDWHDAAIISGPKATYVLVVFTEDGGPNAISDLTAQLQQAFDQ